MSLSLRPGPIIAASHNPGKVSEIADLLRPCGIGILAAADMGLTAPEETGATFAANAALKARGAAMASGYPALADDSGLAIACLDGQPGVYSARMADGDYAATMAALWDAIEAAASGRAASFVCALSAAWPDGTHVVVEGEVRGHIIWPPRGDKGFGYDPFFVADGQERTFAEMEPDEKHAISHRARAFARLQEILL